MSQSVTSTAARATSHLITYDDYLTFPDNDGIRKEIIEGELYMTPAPSTRHQLILKKIFRLLDNYVLQNGLGEVLFAPCDVIFSSINVMQPDILFISNENLNILTEKNIQGAPDLLVEILSSFSTDMDRIYKKMVYEKFGVKEYWIVDPVERIIEIWTRKTKKFELHSKIKQHDSLQSPLLEGLKFKLSEIFRDDF
ncbi:MAG: Uma2 family endonuclease [candidate division KSB1 bacterium]|nr:Uma2 family endonuclease [candidate division KSB1 bacterium]MDZ7342641.1 Uma2 family endonuclease [candidate division KSB1 bacterium]